MKKYMLKKAMLAAAVSLAALLTLTGCNTAVLEKLSSSLAASESSAAVEEAENSSPAVQSSGEEAAADTKTENTAPSEPQVSSAEINGSTNTAESAVAVVTAANTTSDGMINGTELFTDRDLTQTADLSEAVSYTLADGQDITITEAGVYVLTGSASEVTITVDAGDEDKVQLVLDGVSVTNEDFPVIYVKNADKVFVTTTGTENALAVTGSFSSDGDTNTDGVIFSKEDLVLNGTGVLNIYSTDNGVVCKDDLKITGGTYNINAASKAFEANDSIRVADGTFNLVAGTDALHAENADDDTLGYIYICGGDFTIDVGDDGIHGSSIVQIDGGAFTISAAEGIEGTYIQINGGAIDIESWDDGINAANKSGAYRATVEINDGDITIAMSAGDTDGVDSNGDIIVNGGTISVTGNSTFDYDGNAEYNGGTIYVNGQQVDSIPNQMMGGGMGGFGGFGGKRR